MSPTAAAAIIELCSRRLFVRAHAGAGRAARRCRIAVGYSFKPKLQPNCNV
ncbi:hypothetical protein L917_11978 [Phytophthora nicotianae]|uniref:Uncharacterized protein n=4 Tax=Phytophthora nicotianae TaxID=4792 RepID=W2PYS3_PHYN3|nr:hypothetical protein PPTG_23432 [Phytophthora nicotianae INRA-310]ETI42333.1 hypothetical protein F443_12505 [Phytophthora nicotianae P1569]ETL89006.1 hypothetical protein L917_11978 [Phytophthora nicotianae]ETO70975.1 hypothetical protein F444_12600 [Phytophthora nicotianae P1976]ETM42251.1 hypothetical protein L914_12059 [Phytophthora nicotianae]ETN05771.1 hypothetical protein PPTG_23432 [Phytophthora nicotianae INRA-310]